MNYKIIFIAIVGCLFWSCSHQKIKPENGIIDLNAVHLGKVEKLYLSGDFNFIRQQYITSGFGLRKQKIELPGTWRDNYINSKRIPAKGYGTIQFLILNKSNDSLGLQIEDIRSDAEVWINGRFVEKIGRFSKHPTTSYTSTSPCLIKLDKSDSLFVNIPIASYDHSNGGGILKKMVIAKYDHLEKQNKRRLFLENFRINIALLIAIISLILFLFFYRQKVILFFFLMCFSSLIRQIIISGDIIPMLDIEVPLYFHVKLKFIAFFCGACFGSLYFYYLDKALLPKIYIKLIVCTTSILSLTTIFLPVYNFTKILLYFQVLGVLIALYVFFSVLINNKDNSLDRKLSTISICFFIFTITFDIFNGIFSPEQVNISPYGFTIVFISQFFVVLNFIRKTTTQKKYYESELVSKSKDVDFLAIKSKNLFEEKKLILEEVISLIDSGKIASIAELRGIVLQQKNTLLIEEKIENDKIDYNEISLNFISKLKKDFPALTKSEIEICLLIRLNFSNKEISSKRKITDSTIKVAKLRIRNKLNIGSTKEMETFLRSL